VLAWTAVATTFLALLGTASMRMFVAGEPEAVAATLASGRTYLLFVAAFFLPGNALFVLRGALEGIGRTVYTLAGGIAELAARLLVVAFLPSLLGWAGVCLAPAAAWTAASTLLALAWFRERRRFPDA
jgi:Na+-driven multidrug efflux pump